MQAIKYDFENRTILEQRVLSDREADMEVFEFWRESRPEVDAWDVILEKTRAGWDEAWA